MPNIKPISDLRNYTEVLKEVDATGRVYLTRNGHGEYAILTMAEIDELDRYRTANTLFEKLKAAEERAEREGWINADDLEKNWGYLKDDHKILARCQRQTSQNMAGNRG